MNDAHPAHETRRLEILGELEILDTKPEAAFDDITALAAQVCGTSMAIISLIGRARHWFKSHLGLTRSQIPRRGAFCSQAVLQRGVFIVRDASIDERFRGSVLVEEDRVRFYAGAPLITIEGIVLGTLAVMDTEPREMSAAAQRTLELLSRHVVTQLEERRRSLLLTSAMKISEMRFHSVWENSVDGMRLTDEEGRIVAVNEAFCQLFGLSRKELVGEPLTVSYAQSENLEQILQKYRQRFHDRDIETLMERKLAFRSGREVELEVANSFIELPGEAPMVLGLFRDITARKRAEMALQESESQFRLVWENALDGLRLVDESGHFRVVNEAYCRLVERPREALLGQPLSVVYEEKQGREILRQHQEMFRARVIPASLEKEVTLWNGKQIFVQVTNSLLEIRNQPARLLSAFRDLTEHKAVRMKMQRLEQQRVLEKERARIARDMHDELGGSLTRITLLSEIVEAGLADGAGTDAAGMQNRLRKISAMSRDVVRSMDEIVWAVNPGNDTLENFASYICHLTEETFKMTTINCRLDVPPLLPSYFLGSEVRHNLFLTIKEALNNVIKHSRATEVGLQMETRRTDFFVTISDNGRGFEMEKINRFANGLNNMSQRMKAIGAELNIQSQRGGGTVASLRLNLGPADSW